MTSFLLNDNPYCPDSLRIRLTLRAYRYITNHYLCFRFGTIQKSHPLELRGKIPYVDRAQVIARSASFDLLSACNCPKLRHRGCIRCKDRELQAPDRGKPEGWHLYDSIEGESTPLAYGRAGCRGKS